MKVSLEGPRAGGGAMTAKRFTVDAAIPIDRADVAAAGAVRVKQT